MPVTWQNTGTPYNPNLAGDYVFSASWDALPEGVDNSNGLAAPVCTLAVTQGSVLIITYPTAGGTYGDTLGSLTLTGGGAATLPISWTTDTAINAAGASYIFTGALTGNANIAAGGATMDVRVNITAVSAAKPDFAEGFVTVNANSAMTPAQIGEALLPTSGSAPVDDIGYMEDYTIVWSGALDATTAGNSATFTGAISFPGAPAWLTLPEGGVSRLITVSSKIETTVTVTPPSDVVYGTALGDPSAVVVGANDGGTDISFTFTYSGAPYDGSAPLVDSVAKPTRAGNYTVTVVLVSDTHKEFAAMSGYTFFGDGNYGTPIYWRADTNNIWTGKVTLLDLDDVNISGDVDILKMIFDVRDGAEGEAAAVKLNYILLSDGSGAAVAAEIIKDTALTVFAPYSSRYDVNKDGTIDLNDITYALIYLLAQEGDPSWDDAKAIDFNNDSIIDIEE